MLFLWTLFLVLGPLQVAEGLTTTSTSTSTELVAGQWLKCPRSVPISIFCYKGVKPHMLKMFQSSFIEIRAPEVAAWAIYVGNTAADVEQQFHSKQSVLSWVLNQSPKEVQLAPFNSTCLGVAPLNYDGVEARLVVLHVSYYRLCACLAGVFLLFLAPRLARSKVCHYFSGVGFGVMASALILSFVMWRIIPMKRIAMPILACGWMVGVYMMGMVYENARTILIDYQNHLAAYFVITGMLSFLAVHRFGPVSNPKTLDCIQWSLQIAAALLILFSSHHVECAAGILILALSIYNFPSVWSAKISTFVRRRIFRPEHKFITLEEYEDQGTRETEKALKELREFCNTPQSDPWKLQLNLKDPQRFAKFVQGESHLNNEEVLAFSDVQWGEDMLTEDEDY